MAIYEVALHLGTFVSKIMDEMPYEELQGWMAYFKARPYGWREDDRVFKLLQAQGFKGKGSELFESLAQKQQHESGVKENGQLNMAGFKSSTLFHKLLSATGGDKLDL